MKVFFLYFLTLLISLFTYELKYTISRVASFFWTLLDIDRKSVVLKNLKYSGINNPNFLDVWKVFTNYLLDFFYLISILSISKKNFFKLVNTENISAFHKAIKKKNGAFVIAPHLGGFEMAGIYLSAIGLPLIEIVEWRGVGEPHYSFYNRVRKKFGMQILPLEHRRTSILIRNYLRENKIIGSAVDRNLTGKGIPIKFLKGRIAFPKGPIYYAKRFGAQIIVISMIRKRDRYFCKLYNPIYIDSKDEINGLKRIIELLEFEVKNNPYMWYVFQTIWVE